MEDIVLMEIIERYLSGTMLPEEKAYFEQLRKNTPEIDQMVVEHRLFIQQMNIYGEHTNLKHSLHEMHNSLLLKGEIYEGGEITVKGRVIQLWHRYKKVTAIAASIAGITALMISGLVYYFSPTATTSQIQQLSGDIAIIKKVNSDQDKKLRDLNATPHPVGTILSSGTAFLIDGKGYLITNAHVLKGTGTVVVNNKGQEFNARIVKSDIEKDLAILKIDDADYKPYTSLPYNVKKTDIDLGEEIYTLGYPRDEVVYNMGYLSAKSGFNGDTASFQVSINANRGNSGGPVFNKNGEIVGIISTKEMAAEGVVFAVKAKGIYHLVDELKKNDTSLQKIKLPSSSSLKGMNRVEQIKQVEDYIFLVKAYNE